MNNSVNQTLQKQLLTMSGNNSEMAGKKNNKHKVVSFSSIKNKVRSQPEKQKRVFLMAEDDPVDAEIYSEMLNQAFDGRYSVVCVDRFDKIVEALENGDFEILILDMELPDQSGVDNVYKLGKDYPNLPIVVLTGNDDIDVAVESLQSGAQDFLAKNKVTPDMLARSVHYAKERKHIEQQLKNALNDAAYKNVQLEAQSKLDALTGLANRSYFHDMAKRIIMRAQRCHQKTALLYFDLNGFKKVNDTYGHSVGDELLQQVASRLSQVVRDSDFAARLGGDEFVIISDILKQKKDIYPLIKRIQKQLEIDFKFGVHHINISAAIGVAFYPDAENLDILMKQADCAMYEAKSDTNQSVCFYSDKIAEQYERQQKVESYLSTAIEKKEISAVFQPVINASQPKEIHVEVLARWHSNLLGIVGPDEFIPIAENTPAINEITHTMTNESERLLNELADYDLNDVMVAINVSAYQLTNEHFCQLFMSWLAKSNLSPKNICLELTERQFVHNIKQCREQFLFLQQHGIKIALDDFGSGFSSVTHLLELPFDILKIDRFLIDKIDTNTRNQALVAGIVEMAHRLNMQVVAEGIERKEEKDIVIELGCDFLQGYYISKPLNFEQTMSFYTQ